MNRCSVALPLHCRPTISIMECLIFARAMKIIAQLSMDFIRRTITFLLDVRGCSVVRFPCPLQGFVGTGLSPAERAVEL